MPKDAHGFLRCARVEKRAGRAGIGEARPGRELLGPGNATLNEEQQRRKLVPVETVARMCWGSELEGKPRLHPVGRLVLGSDIP